VTFAGHAFILVYSSMVLVEEARAIIGWDQIDDLIRDEDFVRNENDNDPNIARPLQALTDQELLVFKQFITRACFFNPRQLWQGP